MEIIILGAGQVGGSLAEHLAGERNDVTLVDTDAERLRDLADRLDINTVQGHASHPQVLRDAGAEDAELLIAVTASDEINITACQIAHTMFGTPRKIGRIRSRNYMAHPELFCETAIPIDVIIAPEQLVTNYIIHLLEYPGTLQVLDFAGGKVQLAAVKAMAGGPMVGEELRAIRQHMPNVDTRVAAIFRHDRSVLPTGDAVVQAGDEVFFIAAKEHIRAVIKELRQVDRPYKKIIIAGGGNIGERLARSIESQYRVKLIERNYDRCRTLSESLSRTIVLNGSASDKNLLLSEGIEDCDVFCALTNDDEANIMASLLAKRLGAGKVMALITNPAYVDLVQGGEIDIAISPQQITIGSLLTHVRKGDIANVHSLRRGAAEAVEVIAHGDKGNSRVVGKKLSDIDFPKDVSVGAVVRGEKVLIAHRDIIVETDDHLVLFLVDKQKVTAMEKLFQVGLGFFR